MGTQAQFEQNYKRMLAADYYTLRHLAIHLRDSRNHKKLHQLLVGDKAWMDAKSLRFNSDAAYVADLELAITEFTDPIQPEQIVSFIQLHTALQMVYQKSDVYTDTDLKTLVYLGYAERAASSAQLRIKPDLRFSGVISVYETLREKSIQDLSLLRKAREILKIYPTYPSHINKDNAAVQLIRAFAQAGCYSEAIELHTTLKYQNNGMRSIGEIATALAEAQYFSDAFEVLSAGDDSSKTHALPRIALAQAKAGLWDDVFKTVAQLDSIRQPNIFILCEITLEQLRQKNSIETQKLLSELRNKSQKLSVFNDVVVLCRLATGLSEVGLVYAAQEMFIEARDKALHRNIEKPHEQAFVLVELIKGSLKVGIIEGLDILLSTFFEKRQTYSNGDFERNSREIVCRLVEAGQMNAALNIVETYIDDVAMRALTSCFLIVALKRSGKELQFHELFDKMMNMARSISTEATKLETLREIALQLAKSGITTEAQSIVDEVTRDTLAIADTESRSLTYMGFAHALTKIGAFQKALSIANFSPHEPAKSATLRNVVFGLVDIDDLDRALDTALNIPEKYVNKMEALRDVAIGLARTGKIHEATKLRDDLHEGKYNWITDSSPQVAQALSQAGQYAQALKIARSAPSTEGKVASLRVVSAILLREGRKDEAMQIRDEAYQELHGLTDIHRRAVELANLAYYAEALAIVEPLQPSGNKSQMLRDIALTLASSNRFDKALKIAREELSGELRLNILREVGHKLHQMGNLDEAKRIFDEAFEDIPSNFDDVRDGNSVIELVGTLAKCRLFDLAIKAISILPETPDSKRFAAHRDLIPELARCKKLVRGIDLIGSRSLDNFLYVISYCCPAIEQLRPGSTFEILIETTRIATWISSEWKEIFALLTDKG